MKLKWESTLLYNQEGNTGGTGEETTFSAWSGGDMTDEDDGEDSDSGTEGSGSNDSGDEDSNEELGGDEDSGDSANDTGDDKGNNEGDEGEKKEEVIGEEKPLNPEELLKEITARDENKDKTADELKEILENELNKATIEETVLGGETIEEKNQEGEIIDWGKQAVSLGLAEETVKDLTPESFKELIDTKIETEVNAVKQEYSAYDKLGEEAKNFVHHLQENGIEALQDYINPVAKYDQYLSMDKEQLVEENLKAIKDENGNPYYTEEEIADRMVDFEDDEKGLKREYDTIRQSIISGRNQTLQELSNRIQSDRELRQNQQQETIYDIEATSKAITEMESFLDVKVHENGRASVAKMVESGEVEKLIKDPKFLANALMFHKFGKAAIDSIEKRSFDKGKNKSLVGQYNIPLVNGGKPGATAVDGKTKTGTFADWSSDSNE